jgi:RecA-family ATPase
MEGRRFIEKLIEEYKPDGIIIDSMGKVTNGSLSDEIKVRQLNNYYVHLRNKYKAFVWFIHHNRKPNGDNKKPTELADLYGNQYIAAETTVALNLWREKDGSMELSEIKNRLAEQGKPFQVIRGEHLTFCMASEQDSKMVDSLVSRVTNDEPDSSDGGSGLFNF